MTSAELANLIDGAGRPMPSAADLQSFEAAIGSQLSDAYRAFLLATPGGIVRGDLRYSSDSDKTITVELARVAGLTAWDDDALAERFRAAANFQTPEGALSIATDPGGNDVVSVLRVDRRGELLLLDHELADYGDRVTIEDAEESGYARRLAGSFEEFVRGLTLSSS